mmetsp:Transcript_31339/g.79253  ORF Transcript_31339/g.79253 Transcript_31339/m.79253 type:complete len:203 (+) Transcript_31339:42-650(+)
MNSAAGGLSSLEAVKRRLDEDRKRGLGCSSQLAPGVGSSVPRACEHPSARAVGRLQPEDAVLPPRHVPTPPARSPGNGAVAPRRPLGNTASAAVGIGSSGNCGTGATTTSADGPSVGTDAVAARSHGVDLLNFQSDRDNFVYILRFLKCRASWQPPESLEARRALRAEAMYFGCEALVDKLDELERHGVESSSGESTSANGD